MACPLHSCPLHHATCLSQPDQPAVSAQACLCILRVRPCGLQCALYDTCVIIRPYGPARAVWGEFLARCTHRAGRAELVSVSADVVIPVDVHVCCGVCLYEDRPFKVVCINDAEEVIAAPGGRPAHALPGRVAAIAAGALVLCAGA